MQRKAARALVSTRAAGAAGHPPSFRSLMGLFGRSKREVSKPSESRLPTNEAYGQQPSLTPWRDSDPGGSGPTGPAGPEGQGRWAWPGSAAGKATKGSAAPDPSYPPHQPGRGGGSGSGGPPGPDPDQRERERHAHNDIDELDHEHQDVYGLRGTPSHAPRVTQLLKHVALPAAAGSLAAYALGLGGPMGLAAGAAAGLLVRMAGRLLAETVPFSGRRHNILLPVGVELLIGDVTFRCGTCGVGPEMRGRLAASIA